MAAVITVNKTYGAVDDTKAQFIITGTITLTGNYGTSGSHGDTLSFANNANILSHQVPSWVDIKETPPAGTSATGFVYNFSPGTTIANGVLQIFGTGAAAGDAMQEYTEASAYSAPLLAAVLSFQAFFPSFI